MIARYRKFIGFEKTKNLIVTFVESQFAYCPLVWMFNSRAANSKINRLHKRAFRLLYNDDISTFDELLKKAGTFNIHQRNIQSLAIEMFKVKNNTGPLLLNDIFLRRVHHGPSLRKESDFVTPHINSVHFGADSLRYFW